MSMCYDVSMSVKVTDERGAIDALNDYIEQNLNEYGWNLRVYADEGVTRETLDGLARIFLAGWKCNPYKHIVDDNGVHHISNSFNASYGWFEIIEAFFTCIAPFIEKDFEFCYCDEDYEYEPTIKDNGDVEWDAEAIEEEYDEDDDPNNTESLYDYNVRLLGNTYN